MNTERRGRDVVDSGNLYSIQTSARICRVSDEEVRQWIKQGALKAVALPGTGRGVRRLLRIWGRELKRMLGL